MFFFGEIESAAKDRSETLGMHLRAHGSASALLDVTRREGYV